MWQRYQQYLHNCAALNHAPEGQKEQAKRDWQMRNDLQKVKDGRTADVFDADVLRYYLNFQKGLQDNKEEEKASVEDMSVGTTGKVKHKEKTPPDFPETSPVTPKIICVLPNSDQVVRPLISDEVEEGEIVPIKEKTPIEQRSRVLSSSRVRDFETGSMHEREQSRERLKQTDLKKGRKSRQEQGESSSE